MSFDPSTPVLQAQLSPSTASMSGLGNCQCWAGISVNLNNTGTPDNPSWEGTQGGMCNGGTLTLKYYLDPNLGMALEFKTDACNPPIDAKIPAMPVGGSQCVVAAFGLSADCCTQPNTTGILMAVFISDPASPCPLPPPETPCDCASPACASGQPIRYSSGAVILSATDLQSSGYCTSWGHARTFASRLSGPVNMGNGWNWQVREWPYVVTSSGGVIIIMGQAQSVLWFDLSGGAYVPRFNVRDTFQLDSGNKVYVWTQLDGAVTRFSSITGAFLSRTDPGGNTLSVFALAANNVNFGEVRRSSTGGGTTTLESFLYTYDNGAAAVPNLVNLLLRRSTNGGVTWTNVEQATYTYYAANSNFGAPGDLQTVTTANWNGSAWANTGTTMYRYYLQLPGGGGGGGNPPPLGDSSSSSSSGPTPYSPPIHLLKFVVLPASYNQMTAGGINPLTVSDATVLMYADYFYSYDGNGRVIAETVKQASQNFSFTATSSNNAQGYNSWATKTVETLPDGNQNIVYSNYAGQTMLKVFTSPPSTGGGLVKLVFRLVSHPVVYVLPLRFQWQPDHAGQSVSRQRLRRHAGRPGQLAGEHGPIPE